MVMGDLVLLETEINPVMAKMIASGLEITAVHNHVLRGEPGDVLHARRRPRRSGQAGHRDPRRAGRKQDAVDGRGAAGAAARRSISTPPKLDQIIGVKGQANGGVYQFSVPRRDPITRGRHAADARSARWAWRPRSTSSRPAAARPPSPATSS